MLTCMMMKTNLGIIKPLSYNKATILILLVYLLSIVTVISQLTNHPLFCNKQPNNCLPFLVIEKCVHIHYHLKVNLYRNLHFQVKYQMYYISESNKFKKSLFESESYGRSNLLHKNVVSKIL